MDVTDIYIVQTSAFPGTPPCITVFRNKGARYVRRYGELDMRKMIGRFWGVSWSSRKRMAEFVNGHPEFTVRVMSGGWSAKGPRGGMPENWRLKPAA